MQESKAQIIGTILSIIIILVFLGVLFIFMIIYYRVKRKKTLEENQALKIQFSQTLLQSQLEIKEQTLQHLSYELHDNFGQIASLIKINLNTLKFDDIELAKEKIEDTKDLTRQLITDIKDLSVSLGSNHLSRLGLVNALAIEIDRLNKTGQFVAAFENDSAEIKIAPDQAIILYRMVQEILNNCIKHSSAKHITLSVHNQENKYILAINDDGTGFEQTDNLNFIGAGLKNLQIRAHLINAQLKITSTPGKGTQVSISLPL